MAYRRITETEFNYIKELIAKYKNQSKVSRISGRSTSAIRYIRMADSFDEYVKIRPGKNQAKGVVQEKLIKVKEEKKSLRKTKSPREKRVKNYSGALLKEMYRLRKEINSFQGAYILISIVFYLTLLLWMFI